MIWGYHHFRKPPLWELVPFLKLFKVRIWSPQSEPRKASVKATLRRNVPSPSRARRGRWWVCCSLVTSDFNWGMGWWERWVCLEFCIYLNHPFKYRKKLYRYDQSIEGPGVGITAKQIGAHPKTIPKTIPSARFAQGAATAKPIGAHPT